MNRRAFLRTVGVTTLPFVGDRAVGAAIHVYDTGGETDRRADSRGADTAGGRADQRGAEQPTAAAESDPWADHCDFDVASTKVPYERVETRFADHFETVSGSDHDYRPLDETVTTTDRATWKRILLCDQSDTEPHLEDLYDCEEFAMDTRLSIIREWGLNGLGVVIDYTQEAHAYNVLVYETDDGLSFELFEPQNNVLMEPTRDGLHGFEDVLILL